MSLDSPFGFARPDINYTSLRQEHCVLKDTLILEPSQAGHLGQGRKELKDEQLFARLIGAAVLLALAVIILPFVLDGSGSQREYEYAETLPEEPERPLLERSFSSRQPVQTITTVQEKQAVPTRAEIAVSLPASTPTTNLQPTQRTANPSQTTEQLASSVAAAADGAQVSSQAGAQVSAQGASIQRETNVSSLDNKPLQPGWNIQVASFVRDANAVKLIRKLEAQNLPAYANRVQGSSRTLIRVLVGPYGNQVDALALQNSINKDYRVESLIVRGR